MHTRRRRRQMRVVREWFKIQWYGRENISLNLIEFYQWHTNHTEQKYTLQTIVFSIY